jgi:putative CocE/NonD family hydrolase
MLRAFVLLCFTGAALPQEGPGSDPPEIPSEVVLVENERVAMRDSVLLATDLYFPARDGRALPGPFPALVERTPYNRRSRGNLRRAIALAKRGYVVVLQDVRGRFDSEGSWWMLVDDGRDGFDLLAWIGKQPWSNGRIGTMGGSYTGATQHALALEDPPGLQAMFVRETVSNMGKIGLRHHGAFELRFMAWIFSRAVDSREALADPLLKAALAEANERLPEYVYRLPFKPGTTPLRLLPHYEAWLYKAMTESDYGDYWKQGGYNVEEHYARHADVPVVHQTGWHDSWTRSSIDNFLGLSRLKKSPQRLLVGPWVHGGASRQHHGDVDFGEEAAVSDYTDFMGDWFDRWLKDEKHPAEDPPIRLFVMGGGEGGKDEEGRMRHGGRWRSERTWPVEGTRFVPYFLHGDGQLSPEAPPRSDPTTYVFDPRDPVPTIGGNISSAGPLMEPGAFDQRCAPRFFGCKDSLPLAARNDVLVFESAPLEKDIEVTGPIEVRLWVSTSATDTDFTAKLVDVYPPNPDYPHGFAMNLTDSIVRLRYRESLETQKLVEPGEVVPVNIVLYPTSNLFARGHRIRLDISSSNFPRFDVNPNTGEPVGKSRSWSLAVNSLHHGPETPSSVVLPVVER